MTHFEDHMEFGEGWVLKSDGTMVNHRLRQIRTEEGEIISMDQNEDEVGFDDDHFFEIYEDDAYGR